MMRLTPQPRIQHLHQMQMADLLRQNFEQQGLLPQQQQPQPPQPDRPGGGGQWFEQSGLPAVPSGSHGSHSGTPLQVARHASSRLFHDEVYLSLEALGNKLRDIFPWFSMMVNCLARRDLM
jgi:hypothetical protein